jgi:1,4-alpha-glucan branching enzyme
MMPGKKTQTNTTTRPRTSGAHSKTKKHKFSFNAPNARETAIAGSFNNWIPQTMKRSAKGIWTISLHLPPGIHEYRFVVDSEWTEDPINPERAPSPFGGFNSICTVP